MILLMLYLTFGLGIGLGVYMSVITAIEELELKEPMPSDAELLLFLMPIMWPFAVISFIAGRRND